MAMYESLKASKVLKILRTFWGLNWPKVKNVEPQPLLRCSYKKNECIFNISDFFSLKNIFAARAGITSRSFTINFHFLKILSHIRGCAKITSSFLRVLKTPAPPYVIHLSSSWDTPPSPHVINLFDDAFQNSNYTPLFWLCHLDKGKSVGPLPQNLLHG